MSDGDALLAAILESPADDTPRLVYADWLQENGQAERAGFIRVQIELAELSHDDAVNCAPRRVELAARERTFIGPKNPHREWFTSLPGGWGLKHTRDKTSYDRPVLFVGRGFGCRASSSVADWLNHGAVILSRNPIEAVRLPLFRVEIESFGPNGLWLLRYYEPGEDSPIANSALLSRAEMISQLMQDVHELESEFA